MPRAPRSSQTLLLLIACLLPCALHCKAVRDAKPAVELPTVELPGTRELQPATRIVVTANGIDVDNSAVVDSWPREKREQFIATLEPEERQSVPLVEREVVKLSSGRMTGVDLLADWPGLRQVRQVIDAAFKMEQRFHWEILADEAFAPRIVMAIDPSVPYETVDRVLSIVSQSGAKQYSFLVRASGGRPVEIVASLPERLPAVGCHIPRMTLVDQGLAIELVPRFEVPGPARRQLVPSLRECPSVPRRDGPIDIAVAEGLLKHVEVLSGCPEALIGATGARPWGEVAQVAAAAVRAERHLLQFFLATPEFSGELSQCSNAVECPGPQCPSSFPSRPLPQGGRPPVPRPPR